MTGRYFLIINSNIQTSGVKVYGPDENSPGSIRLRSNNVSLEAKLREWRFSFCRSRTGARFQAIRRDKLRATPVVALGSCGKKSLWQRLPQKKYVISHSRLRQITQSDLFFRNLRERPFIFCKYSGYNLARLWQMPQFSPIRYESVTVSVEKGHVPGVNSNPGHEKCESRFSLEKVLLERICAFSS